LTIPCSIKIQRLGPFEVSFQISVTPVLAGLCIDHVTCVHITMRSGVAYIRLNFHEALGGYLKDSIIRSFYNVNNNITSLQKQLSHSSNNVKRRDRIIREMYKHISAQL